jgi:hypothetical protein
LIDGKVLLLTRGSLVARVDESEVVHLPYYSSKEVVFDQESGYYYRICLISGSPRLAALWMSAMVCWSSSSDCLVISLWTWSAWITFVGILIGMAALRAAAWGLAS